MLTTGEINDLMYQVFVLALKLGGPILIISMVVGIVISILQAATQIHEQTLTFVSCHYQNTANDNQFRYKGKGLFMDLCRRLKN